MCVLLLLLNLYQRKAKLYKHMHFKIPQKLILPNSWLYKLSGNEFQQKPCNCCTHLSSGGRPHWHLFSPVASARACWRCRKYCFCTIPHHLRCREGRKSLRIGQVICRRSRGGRHWVEYIPGIHCQIRAHHWCGLFSTSCTHLQEIIIITSKWDNTSTFRYMHFTGTKEKVAHLWRHSFPFYRPLNLYAVLRCVYVWPVPQQNQLLVLASQWHSAAMPSTTCK